MARSRRKVGAREAGGAGAAGNAWRNRIVGHGEEAPEQLLANPHNFRIHPQHQQAALGGSLEELGWIQEVIVNRTTGHVIDGHLRIELAISKEERAIPVTYVELTEEEERLALLSLDPIAALAVQNTEAMKALLDSVEATSEGLRGFFEALSRGPDLGDVEEGPIPDLASGDRDPFRQMTFTVHDEQFEEIEAAIRNAKADGGGESAVNENSNGNALAWICGAFNRGRDG